ncbi:zinc-binding protein A33-like [Latimeria chalumnae]|uniref:zinc-binding protein A33-like n=1 Tax=Latimeria chalumnae TaxID=7897 RepID=UPI00313E97F3
MLANDRMRRQLSCSFCNELYREPILLQCDHNLCRTCLPKVQVGTGDSFKCPECHQDCNKTELRKNPLLENIVEHYRDAERNQQFYCEEHGVRLELFCEEEQKAICLVCGTSQRHRDHEHEAIAVAADGYKPSTYQALESITIDVDTVHGQLIVSRDRSSIKLGLTQQDLPHSQRRFLTSFAALGSRGFTSGRHYWEVEVGGKSFWMLGVAKESIERGEPPAYSPQDGLWALGLGNRNSYVGFSPEAEALPPLERPRKIGIYLDYEGGKVSFYNADNMCHIYTYTDMFTERMYPYFNPHYCEMEEREDDLPLRIPPL